MTSIIWFREDLRLSDQAALRAAADEGPVIPVYVLDDGSPGHWKMGAAQRWWLHHSLRSLAADLDEKGSRLILLRGEASVKVGALADKLGIERVHALEHFEPWWRKQQDKLSDRLELCLHQGKLLMPPGTVTTNSGDPYKIFTPFWKSLQQVLPPGEPQRTPQRLEAPDEWPDSDRLDDWKLLPESPNWAEGFDAWTPGEAAARRAVRDFADRVADYDDGRNLPSEDLTSQLSPHLHMGEVSPAYVWHSVAANRQWQTVETFLSELAWRDFCSQTITMFPDYGDEHGRDQFEKMDWTDTSSGEGREHLQAWQQGRTGYPIVDAGMRQLWHIGWMHNRVRMIAAQFLIKHLLIDWREGERWFWDTLVDADYGNNSQNWQWSAGAGIDSHPFHRMMNPKTQSPKWEAAGYIREWVPELAALSDKDIHVPWEAGEDALDAAGITLGKEYPEPVVEHQAARERALSTYRKAKG
ncbi:deoxyribodipyrimidine photolyase [Pacificimonas flava]|uniref:Deoxyribodipyrimidine photo-lyase n=2 Tax=Pacificimonas TaxID=1960290 RepID=A0A219B3W0_9SPHN|nr:MULTISPECIES: deoxyribodipyrimidine photo-lyase [Pacificimonas]MBZ6377487.1 deoxyribodipyrimidine photo-lyase [Pacificimonas aurantium]OWV32816.1 deoxyribodipyrimidine photolyase [Pacificimonas flava]